MRVLLGILAVLLGGLNAAAQKTATLGLDVAETFRSGNVKIMAGYGFHEKWSIRYDTTISMQPTRRKGNPEYETHNGEFVAPAEKETSALTTCISFQYWPVRTFRGIYTEIGCRYGYRDMPCCIVGIGYSIPIWKGLSAVLSYSTERHFAMEICWRFGNIY